MSQSPAAQIEEIVEEILSLLNDKRRESLLVVKKACAFAEQAHRAEKRYSGEPYIIHPLETAKILAAMQADVETVVAGLLHDTVENHVATSEEIKKEFGPTVAFLVDGVTKLGKLKYQGLERHVESLRKLFVAMAEDIRVIVIRLADRLHNVRTLEFVPIEKQKRIALETLEIYAPLANRLGIWKIKGELEDASFPYVYPAEYKQVVALRKTKGRASLKKLEKLYRAISRAVAAQNIEGIRIDYRIKHLYSLWRKLIRHQMDLNQIYDISALRIIVPTVADCYQLLGLVHTLWRPVSGKLKDYIAQPKPNGYQSIHTAIFTGDGGTAEIQIRTEAMQHEAEYGVASHILYAEAGKPKTGAHWKKKIAWIKELIDWQKSIDGSEEFLTHLKTDFFQDRIFVFTPKGDVIELPKAATPIDFAYAIHSEIGDHAAGATINGKFVGMDTPLKSHDVVVIEVKKTARPTVKWLAYARTTMARKHIRTYLKLKG